MNIRILGKTGIEVTELCFGTLPMGPLQKNLSDEESADLIVEAVRGGVNFIDTAQFYRTYAPIKLALKRVDKRPVIASKSIAQTYNDMQEAIDQALKAMGVDYIDIFHLHSARVSSDVYKIRKGAFECLVENKKKGKIKAVGVSGHSVKLIDFSADVDEVDVVFPLINIKGTGILEGTKEDMEKAIAKCVNNNKGVYLMKVLAGGSIVGNYQEALEYARSIKGYASIAIGMVNKQEIDYNIKYFNNENLSWLPSITECKKSFIAVESLCQGCFACVDACPNGAISPKGQIAFIDQDRCLKCGYCVKECPEFAIRMI